MIIHSIAVLCKRLNTATFFCRIKHFKNCSFTLVGKTTAMTITLSWKWLQLTSTPPLLTGFSADSRGTPPLQSPAHLPRLGALGKRRSAPGAGAGAQASARAAAPPAGDTSSHRSSPRFWKMQVLSSVSPCHLLRWQHTLTKSDPSFKTPFPLFALSGARPRAQAAEGLGVRRHRRQEGRASPGHRTPPGGRTDGQTDAHRRRPASQWQSQPSSETGSPFPIARSRTPRRCPARPGPATQPRTLQQRRRDPAAPATGLAQPNYLRGGGEEEDALHTAFLSIRTEKTGFNGVIWCFILREQVRGRWYFHPWQQAKNNSSTVTPVPTMVPPQLKARVRWVGRHGNGGGCGCGCCCCCAAPAGPRAAVLPW